jgi:type IV secretory pathway VirB10-like protein
LKFETDPADTSGESTVMFWLRAFVVIVIVGWALPASGQSLAAVARKEEVRRKQVKQPAKVITNKDLRPVTTPPPPPPAAEPPAPPADDAAPAGEAAPDEAQQREQDEQAWRSKMADARQALERNQMYADALQSKINALWADFTARDNPVQRAQIEIERQKALAEQERVKAEIGAQKKAIADLEEEARKAGVPPGWLR